MAAQGFSTYKESGTFRSRHASQQSVEKTALALIYNTEYFMQNVFRNMNLSIPVHCNREVAKKENLLTV